MSLSATFTLNDEASAARLAAFLKANWRSAAAAKKPLSVTVAEWKAKRSDEQNKRLHAILGHIAENAWVNARRHSMETWKEFFKCEFIGADEWTNPITGEVIKRGISTTKLSVGEFAEFMTKIEQYAREKLGIEI